jgi:hypothetical protein
MRPISRDCAIQPRNIALLAESLGGSGETGYGLTGTDIRGLTERISGPQDGDRLSTEPCNSRRESRQNRGFDLPGASVFPLRAMGRRKGGYTLLDLAKKFDVKPEEEARQKIDLLLGAAGWSVQDYALFNPSASLGVALREVTTSCW